MGKQFNEYILGANYWPRNHGIEMWKEWEPKEIKKEFEEARALGLNLMRINLFWEDFQPKVDVISEEAVNKFDELIHICKEVGMQIAPTFFIGHMSGENWDIPWREGRDIYSDSFMLKQEAKLVGYFAKKYCEEDSILFWDLSNEPDNYVKPKTRQDAWLWNYFLSGEIKRYDQKHPVTLGIHTSSLLEDNKMYPEDMAEGNDFLCMHAYPIYTDTCMDPVISTRSTYMLPFVLKLTEGMGSKEVMLEEFGGTTLMMSDDIEGRYYKNVLYSLFANESLGAIAWCFGDFSQTERLPYNTSPFETEFGITKVNGLPKRAGLELKGFSAFVKQFEFQKLKHKKCDVAILIPDRYYNSYFVGSDYTAERNFRGLYNSFILAKEAGLNVEFVKASGDFSSYKMLILPSVYRKSHLNVDQWHRVMKFVEEGGTLYASYDGMAVEGFDEVFGVETQYFMVPKDKEVLITSKTLDMKLSYEALKFNKRLICKTTTGDAIGFDNEGNPAIIMNRYGKGSTLLLTYPVELYLSYMPDVYKKDKTYEIYSLAKRLGNIQYEFEVDSPFVEVKMVDYKQDNIALVINHEEFHVCAATNKTGIAVDLISRREVSLEQFEIGAGEVMALRIK